MKINELFNVQGQVAVVTGGAGGLGVAFTEALAENGATVVMMDLNQAALDTEVTRLQDLGYRVEGVKLDVTDREGVYRAFDNVMERHGKIDTVFANAGIDPGPGYVTFDRSHRPPAYALENYEDARWDKALDINLNGVFATLRAAAKHMKVHQRGQIIVTTSVAAFAIEGALGMAYMVAKAGAAHLTRNVALELARYGIRVNSIAPGPFATSIGGGWLLDPTVQSGIGRHVPLGRVARPEEMKGLALFLASRASSYVTGAQFVIDGGQSIGVADWGATSN